MKRPPTPAAYCLPSFIELKPVKNKMQKPYWSVRTDSVGVYTCSTKAKAHAYLRARLLRADMSDGEIYEQLRGPLGLVLLYPQHYSKSKCGQYYQSKDDKHEWHHADEVGFMLWYIAQAEAA